MKKGHIVPKEVCKYCGREISKSNMSKHIRSHENGNFEKYVNKSRYQLDHSDLFCKFCGKECKSTNSLCQHEIRCKDNPSRLIVCNNKFSNKGRTAWNKGLTKETDERVRKNGESVSRCRKEHPELFENCAGFTYNSQKYSYKYGTYKGYYCDSSWELAFIMYCIDNGIDVERNTSVYFEYDVGNKRYKFYPDFIIGNVFYEIKGGYDKNIEYKLKCFPSNKILVLINKDGIKKYLNYAKSTYGLEFASMYDRECPSWMDMRM